MPSANKDFALYCCDLLAGVGPCVAKSLFGGFGISVDGLTLALMTNLGGGDKLYLKTTDDSAVQFRLAGGEQFLYETKGVPKGMNYYTAPQDAMESPALMLPWARLAMQAALTAANSKKAKATQANKVTKVTKVIKATKTGKTTQLGKMAKMQKSKS